MRLSRVSKGLRLFFAHGNVGDKTVESLKPYLNAGDVIVDGANELYLNTQRRQQICKPLKVHYVGTECQEAINQLVTVLHFHPVRVMKAWIS